MYCPGLRPGREPTSSLAAEWKQAAINVAYATSLNFTLRYSRYSCPDVGSIMNCRTGTEASQYSAYRSGRNPDTRMRLRGRPPAYPADSTSLAEGIEITSSRGIIAPSGRHILGIAIFFMGVGWTFRMIGSVFRPLDRRCF